MDGAGSGEGIGRHPAWSQILTGAWVSAIEREAIFQGLWARHTWAVWDTRALVWFEVNSALMGDDLTVAPGTALTARVRVSAESPLQTVEIVSAGAVVWNLSSPSGELDARAELGAARTATQFYLRGLLRNGGLFYASPVFVEVEPGKAGGVGRTGVPRHGDKGSVAAP